MLDIKLIRENPAIVKQSESKRGKDVKIVDKILKLDAQWRKLKQDVDKLRGMRNKLSKQINKFKKQKQEDKAKKLIQEAKQIPEKIKKIQAQADKVFEERDSLRYQVGNILHKSVPKKQKVVRTWGKKTKFAFKPKSHVDLIAQLDLADTKKAGEVVGARFYYLKNELVLLNFALQKFAFDLLMKKGYIPILTPFMLGENAMKGVSELGDFKETLYKIDGENLYLIATSEQTIIAYHYDEIIPETELPLKYIGFSTNFRKEAGAHGKDTKGIFRTHQFDKIEQIVFCKPEDSWKFHEEMTKNSEELYQKLGIPYRVVNIGADDMNDNGAKKYDIEGWFPVQKQYRELGSGTNCTDYQARKSKIKMQKKNNTIDFLHTLNCTGLATERTIVAILENFQQKDGTIKIPKVLWEYTGFKEIKPKKNEVKKNSKNK